MWNSAGAQFLRSRQEVPRFRLIVDRKMCDGATSIREGSLGMKHFAGLIVSGPDLRLFGYFACRRTTVARERDYAWSTRCRHMRPWVRVVSFPLATPREDAGVVEADLALSTESGGHAPHRTRIGTAMITEISIQALALVAQRCGHDDLADGARPVPLAKPRGHIARADESGALWLSSESKMIEASGRSGGDFAAPPRSMRGSPAAVAVGRRSCLLRHRGRPRGRNGRKFMDPGHKRRG